MKTIDITRFLNKQVVGQKKNGLFFEGKVEDVAGSVSIVEAEDGSALVIDAREIYWLVEACRYC